MMEKEKLDWEEYRKIARSAAAEGCVLLRNERNTLPVKKGSRIALFGRMQNHYYKSGTGSGGMVNVSKVYGITEGLLESGEITLSESLREEYDRFEKESPFEQGIGFGNEPWSQKEMEVSVKLAKKEAEEADLAIVFFARTAGEEQDNKDVEGSYRFTKTELSVLKTVRDAFDRVVLVLNIGSVMDMEEVLMIGPDSILIAWQGGMEGGLGLADVLLGKVCPSGKLTDTIAKSAKDYPAYDHFGDPVENIYAEDIYVGYRYFETFAKDKVRFPFGFGLSYTEFSVSVENRLEKTEGEVSAAVKNIGNCSGKQTVFLFVKEPQGKLGKSVIRLVSFRKTKTLKPEESEKLVFAVKPYDLASYDEFGITGYESSYVLEKGTYQFYLGTSVRDLWEAGETLVSETILIEKLLRRLPPDREFTRLHPGKQMENGEYEKSSDTVFYREQEEEKRRRDGLPADIPYTKDQGLKLEDVRDGKCSMESFLAQLSDDDLVCIARGEGMGSPKVTPGTAAAFGGVSRSLKEKNIPCGCCSDGPSGMRIDCGKKAFSLPNGTLLACTFNEELNEKLYYFLGLEMAANHVDVLLGPGMNLHRYPLNGRNFEYFSEDPVVTGRIAAAQIVGMKKAGVSGTLKHFCGNNQEYHRRNENNIISERALRELYLKGFEIAVKSGAEAVMTTYGPVNGIWTNSSYDLNTGILRDEWGFKGIVMTDWWPSMGTVREGPKQNDFAALIKAQNDFYAVCPEASVNSMNDNLEESLKNGTLLRSELLRSAANICRFLMNSRALKRMLGEEKEIEIINRKETEEEIDLSNITYYPIVTEKTVDLSGVVSERGKSYVFALDAEKKGGYCMTITGSSELSEVAQIPVTVYVNGIVTGVYTFHGTGGENKSMSGKILMFSKYGVVRLYFGGGGLNLKEIKFTFDCEVEEMGNISEYLMRE